MHVSRSGHTAQLISEPSFRFIVGVTGAQLSSMHVSYSKCGAAAAKAAASQLRSLAATQPRLCLCAQRPPKGNETLQESLLRMNTTSLDRDAINQYRNPQTSGVR